MFGFGWFLRFVWLKLVWVCYLLLLSMNIVLVSAALAEAENKV
jgi:hypothetical protein